MDASCDLAMQATVPTDCSLLSPTWLMSPLGFCSPTAYYLPTNPTSMGSARLSPFNAYRHQSSGDELIGLHALTSTGGPAGPHQTAGMHLAPHAAPMAAQDSHVPVVTMHFDVPQQAAACHDAQGCTLQQGMHGDFRPGPLQFPASMLMHQARAHVEPTRPAASTKDSNPVTQGAVLPHDGSCTAPAADARASDGFAAMLQVPGMSLLPSQHMPDASPGTAAQTTLQSCKQLQSGNNTSMQHSVSPTALGRQCSHSAACQVQPGQAVHNSDCEPAAMPPGLGVAPIRVALKDKPNGKQPAANGTHTLRLMSATPLPPPQVLSMPATKVDAPPWQQLVPTLDLEGNSQPAVNAAWAPPMRRAPSEGSAEEQRRSPNLPGMAEAGDGDAVCDVVGLAPSMGVEMRSSMGWKTNQLPPLQVNMAQHQSSAPNGLQAAGTAQVQAAGGTTADAPHRPVSPAAAAANGSTFVTSEQQQPALHWSACKPASSLQLTNSSRLQQPSNMCQSRSEQIGSPGAELYAACSSVPVQGHPAQPQQQQQQPVLDSNWPRWDTPYPDSFLNTIDCSGEMSTPTLTPTASDDDGLMAFNNPFAQHLPHPWSPAMHQYCAPPDAHNIPAGMHAPFAPQWLPYDNTGFRPSAHPWPTGHPHMFAPHPMMQGFSGMPSAQHQRVHRMHPAYAMPPHLPGGYAAYHPHGYYQNYMPWPPQRPLKQRKKRKTKQQPVLTAPPALLHSTVADCSIRDMDHTVQPACYPTLPMQAVAVAEEAHVVDTHAAGVCCSNARTLHGPSAQPLPTPESTSAHKIPTPEKAQAPLDMALESTAYQHENQGPICAGSEQGGGASEKALQTGQHCVNADIHAMTHTGDQLQPQVDEDSGQGGRQQQQQRASLHTATCNSICQPPTDTFQQPSKVATAPAASTNGAGSIGYDVASIPNTATGSTHGAHAQEGLAQQEAGDELQLDMLLCKLHPQEQLVTQAKDTVPTGLRVDAWSAWDHVGLCPSGFSGSAHKAAAGTGLDYLATCLQHPLASASSAAPVDAQPASTASPAAAQPPLQLGSTLNSIPGQASSQQAPHTEREQQCLHNADCLPAAVDAAQISAQETLQQTASSAQHDMVAMLEMVGPAAAAGTSASLIECQAHQHDAVAVSNHLTSSGTEAKMLQQHVSDLQGCQTAGTEDSNEDPQPVPLPAASDPATCADQHESSAVACAEPGSSLLGPFVVLQGKRTGIRRPRAIGSLQPQLEQPRAPAMPAASAIALPLQGIPSVHPDAQQLLQSLQSGGHLLSRALSQSALLLNRMPNGATANAQQVQQPTHNKRARAYFEFAKLSWEQEPATQLPRGLGSWVVVARQGNASGQDKGLVYCRLCLAYRLQHQHSVMTDGYQGGKRSALRDHMNTEPHIRLVNMIEEGTLPAPPSYHELRQTPLPPCVPPEENTPDTGTPQKPTKPRKRRKAAQQPQRHVLQTLQPQLVNARSFLPPLSSAVMQFLGAAAQMPFARQGAACTVLKHT